MASSAERSLEWLTNWCNAAKTVRVEFSSGMDVINLRMHGQLSKVSRESIELISHFEAQAVCKLAVPLAQVEFSCSENFDNEIDKMAADLSPSERGRLRATSLFEAVVSIKSPSGSKCLIALLPD